MSVEDKIIGYESGDLVVVSHWSDFDWPSDAVELGILSNVKDGYYYINNNMRGYKHCKVVHRKVN